MPTQYLHLNDKSKELPRGDANHDKLFKVRPLLDAVVVVIKSEYLPSKSVSINEAMIPFKGRLGMKQYMPQKPTKGSTEVWDCADSANGYVVDLSVYTGKERGMNAEQGLGYRVVHKLTRPLVGKNHHVFIDNFFSSIPLIAPTTQQVKRLQQGESLFLRKGNLVVTVWKDKKPVYFLSTQSNPVGDIQVNRRQRDGSIIQVPSVPVVKLYNNNMGGVDLNDQLHGYYMTGRQSKNGGVAFCGFLSTSVLSMPTFWRNCRHATGTELSLLFALT